MSVHMPEPDQAVLGRREQIVLDPRAQPGDFLAPDRRCTGTVERAQRIVQVPTHVERLGRVDQHVGALRKIMVHDGAAANE